jgi:hypothetical protein
MLASALSAAETVRDLMLAHFAQLRDQRAKTVKGGFACGCAMHGRLSVDRASRRGSMRRQCRSRPSMCFAQVAADQLWPAPAVAAIAAKIASSSIIRILEFCMLWAVSARHGPPDSAPGSDLEYGASDQEASVKNASSQ